MGWGGGGGVIWLLRVHLTRTRTAASSTEAKSGKKMRVSEREDKTIREVKMNERKWMIAKLKRDGETHMNSAVTSFSISFQSGNNS